MLKDILSFVELTQNKLTTRDHKKERWEQNTNKWLNKCDEEGLKKALTNLRFINAIAPKSKIYDAICILGSTMQSMKDRLEYAHKIFDKLKVKPKNLILLAGERSAVVNIDGTKDELQKIAEVHRKTIKKVTETELIIEACDNEHFENIKRHVIDTPASNLSRPTTETTIMELVKWLKNHDNIKKILFCSDQPYVLYQQVIIKTIFKSQKFELIFEVVGPKYSTKNINIEKVINSYGSYIFAQAPIIIKSLNCDISTFKTRLKNIYGNNEYIYKYITD